MDDVIQALVTQLYGPVIARKLLEEIGAGAADSFGVGIVVKGRLLEKVEHRAFLVRRQGVFSHEQRYCRSLKTRQMPPS